MNIKTLSVEITPERADVHILAVKEDGSLAGLAVVGLGKGENAGWLSNVFVQPEDRGRGFGRKLVEEAIEACRAVDRGFISMVVKNDNDIAKKLYESLGFLPFMDGSEGHTQYLKAL